MFIQYNLYNNLTKDSKKSPASKSGSSSLKQDETTKNNRKK